jgi:phosphatidate cytidylyltransferase
MKRWVTGLVAIPVLILVIGPAPRWVFQVFTYLIAILALFEFLKMTVPQIKLKYRLMAILFAALFYYFTAYGLLFLLLPALPMAASVLLCLYLFGDSTDRGHAPQEIGAILLGLLYIVAPIALILFMDKYPNGNLWIFFLLATIILSDTGAFYAGRWFGRHKLYPTVSPGKTWEGAFGGLLLSLTTPLIFFFAFPAIFPLRKALFVLVLFLSVACQVGDLAESMLKRSSGLKDSGTLLPGHGGLLDRIDGLLFAIPILYLYLRYAIP